MKFRNHYIALWLAGMFAFPVLLQPLHIAHHRAFRALVQQVAEHDFHSKSCHHNPKEQDPVHSRGPVITPGVKDHPCYICEFRFPAQEPPAGMILVASHLPGLEIGPTLPAEPVYLCERLRITSRGPPAA